MKITNEYVGEVNGLGAYSEYTIADENICFPVPETMSGEEASTVPLASCTALLGLFSNESLALDAEAAEKSSVLIWGGSCKSLANANNRL